MVEAVSKMPGGLGVGEGVGSEEGGGVVIVCEGEAVGLLVAIVAVGEDVGVVVFWGTILELPGLGKNAKTEINITAIIAKTIKPFAFLLNLQRFLKKPFLPSISRDASKEVNLSSCRLPIFL